MTLALALGNTQFVTVVADRRLTVNGALSDDEANKVCFLCCDDARVAIAFTGLAEAGTFSTQEWIVNTLASISQATHVFTETLILLQRRASEEVSRVAAPDRRLTFIIAGFVYWSERPEVVCHYLSNIENASGRAGPAFELRTLNVSADGLLVEAIGAPSTFNAADASQLRTMLAQGKRPADVVRKAVHSIQNAARAPAANGLIGKQCNSAVVPAEPNSTMVSTYHSAHVTGEAYGADIAFNMSNGGMWAMGTRLLSDSLVAGPPIRKRDPCWCGSGRLFKHCHMRSLGNIYAQLPGFTKPLSMVASVTCNTAVPSGSQFTVSSAFE